MNLASSAKLYAERRAGELLAETPGLGSHGGDRRSSNTTQLENLGVTKIESSRWQKLAQVDGFDEIVDQLVRVRAVVS